MGEDFVDCGLAIVSEAGGDDGSFSHSVCDEGTSPLWPAEGDRHLSEDVSEVWEIGESAVQEWLFSVCLLKHTRMVREYSTYIAVT